MITPIIGLIATLAPTVGPTVGGYLTEALSWHWLFFINIIPGIAVTVAALALIDFDKPDYALLDHFDWWGLIAMAGFPRRPRICAGRGPAQRLAPGRGDRLRGHRLGAFGRRVLLSRASTARAPIVDLRAFGNRNFALGSMFSFVLGIGLYGLTYLYPRLSRAGARLQFADDRRNHVCLGLGDVLQRASCRPAGRRKFDPRFMLIGGFLLFALGTFDMHYLTKDWDFWELFVPQIFRGVGLMFAMVPVTNVALGTLSPERLKNASGLFNLMRNLGGAIGLAALNTVLNDRMDLHLARLHDAVNWSRGPATDMLANLTARFHDFGSNAQSMALKQMSLMARREATVMSFSDVFLLMTVLFVGLAVLGIVMKRPAAPAGAAGGRAAGIRACPDELNHVIAGLVPAIPI